MKGVTIFRDEATLKRIIQIDVDAVDADDEFLEDFVDAILAEAAKDDEKIPWEDAKEILRKEGRL